ncbi:uncharacterized protein LOC136076165 [Hydra vulgaris]|uniref:Uncharacterized protein LOC136076165 n=1 Tax=Hydra vulgaris TaxID=6087 RepID=A0ABM4B9Y0_HYDVU
MSLTIWLKVSAFFHKVLAHADKVIINSPAPFGLMGEKATEPRHFSFKLYLPTISRKLKRSDLSRKLVVHIDARYAFASEINGISNEKLIYLDETVLNGQTNSTYGYLLRGAPAILQSSANRSKNVSLICIVLNIGVLAYETKIGSWNAESFCTFITTMLAPAIRNVDVEAPVLVMENCKFNRSLSIRRTLASHGIIFKYLPAYTPHLNPIEEFFSSLKHTYKQRERPQNTDGVIRRL